MKCAAQGYSSGRVCSVHYLRNCWTAASLRAEKTHETITVSRRATGGSVGGDPGLTRVCDTVVIHVRVRPGPEFAFGWPVSTRREDRGRCGQGCS